VRTGEAELRRFEVLRALAIHQAATPMAAVAFTTPNSGGQPFLQVEPTSLGDGSRLGARYPVSLAARLRERSRARRKVLPAAAGSAPPVRPPENREWL